MTQFLRISEVMTRTSLSRSSIYSLAAKGEFPNPVKLTPRASAWASDEIDAWIETRRAERDQAA